MSATTQPTATTRRIRVTTNAHPEEINARTVQEVKAQLPEPTNQLDVLQAAFKQTGQSMEIKPVSDDESVPLAVKSPHNKFDKMPSPAKTELPSRRPVADKPPAASFQPRITEPTVPTLGEHAIRINVPSNCAFYDFDDFTIRPFSVAEFAKIYRGNQEGRDDLIIDVVNDTTSIDVWNLTEKDFRFIMYWQRLNSFVRNPYKLNWTSFYGNQNTITISKSNLQINELNSSKENYQQWQQRGFTMPTMRDLNEYNNLASSLTAEDRFLWVRAKYLTGNSVQDKLARARSGQITPDEFFFDLRDFVGEFENYGVVESVQETDAKFNSAEAVVKLAEFIRNNKLILDNKAIPEDIYQETLERVARLQDELARINTQLQTTGEAAPLRETVTFSISVTDFFPLLQR